MPVIPDLMSFLRPLGLFRGDPVGSSIEDVSMAIDDDVSSSAKYGSGDAIRFLLVEDISTESLSFRRGDDAVAEMAIMSVSSVFITGSRAISTSLAANSSSSIMSSYSSPSSSS